MAAIRLSVVAQKIWESLLSWCVRTGSFFAVITLVTVARFITFASC